MPLLPDALRLVAADSAAAAGVAGGRPPGLVCFGGLPGPGGGGGSGAKKLLMRLWDVGRGRRRPSVPVLAVSLLRWSWCHNNGAALRTRQTEV